MTVSVPALILLTFLVAQRLGELALSRRNTRRLLSRGATEYGAGHYPYMVGLHGAWLLTLIWFGIGQDLSLPWLAVFVALQLVRVWIIWSLGERWTTRIIVLPEPLITKGPFAWARHPNYLLVIAEILTVPMIFGLPVVAAVFSALNAAMLVVRISTEEEALTKGREGSLHHREMLSEQFEHRIGADGRPEKEALRVVAAELRQFLGILFRLDALGDDIHFKIARH